MAVLIVDDDPEARGVLAELLQAGHLDIAEAESGESTLEYVARATGRSSSSTSTRPA